MEDIMDKQVAETSAPAVTNAVSILRLLAASAPSHLGVSDIARGTGIGKASCHRILQALGDAQCVVQNPVTRAYSLGPALIELGERAAGSEHIMGAARAVLPSLAKSTGMSAAIFRQTPDARMVAVACEQGPGTYHVSQAVGRSFPLVPPQATVQFAWSSPQGLEQLEAVAAARGYRSYRENLPELREDVEFARKHGYAWTISAGRDIEASLSEFGPWLEDAAKVGVARRALASRKLHLKQIREFESERRSRISLDEIPPAPIFGLAAPVFDVQGALVFQIAITGFLSQVPPSKIPELGRLVVERANMVTGDVGGRFPSPKDTVQF